MADATNPDPAKAAETEAKNADSDSPTIQKNEDRGTEIQTPVNADAEKKRKSAPQDRTSLEATDHVTYHLDRDPNDPRVNN